MMTSLDRQPELASFSAREATDPAVGLLDAWATVLDVVTFYQERIANEGFLRTATELKSVYQLAAEIGYVPRPGVATTTYLAFEVESGKGAPAAPIIDVGVKVQSVPGPNEKPQTFETVEKLVARPEWNRIRPRLTDPARMPQAGDTTIFLASASTGLKHGEPILVVWQAGGASQADLRTVASTSVDTDLRLTVVTLDAPLGTAAPVLPTSLPAVGVYALRQKAALLGHNAPPWTSMSQKFRDDYTTAVGANWNQVTGELFSGGFYYLSGFDFLGGVLGGGGFTDWPPAFSLTTISTTNGAPASALYLDAVYPGVLQNTLAVLSYAAGSGGSAHARVFHLNQIEQVSAQAFTIAASVTRLTLDPDPAADFDLHVRDTSVFMQSEQLAVAWPDADAVSGKSVAFEGRVTGLTPGQALAFSGPLQEVEVGADFATWGWTNVGVTLKTGEVLRVEQDPIDYGWAQIWFLRRFDGTSLEAFMYTFVPGLSLLLPHPASETSDQLAEVVFIDKVDDSDPLSTRVTLKKALENRYDRRRLTIAANVVLATHGETKTEVLGSGDASQPFQKFALRQSPLTFVPSASGSGASTTLQVRVHGVSWQEAATLDGRGPRDRVYLARVADDGKVTVEFGDGTTGARVPTGPENITAVYRIGIGLGARVRRGQLSLLQTRPLGVKTVTNPVPATGGAEPEALAQARRNAPLTVLTFDRVVSLTDYENYAAAFAGVAKATAAWLWDGHRRLVHVTVAAEGGAAVDANTALMNLTGSIRSAGDQRQPFVVQSYQAITFDLSARIYRDLSYEWATVEAAARAAVSNAFAFDAMDFAVPVTESAVLATLQAVPGVLGVRLVGLNLTGGAVFPNPVLTALPARLVQSAVKPAQLLILNPQGLYLKEQI
jgi:hypothetical protein